MSPTGHYIAKMANALNADAEIVFRPRGSKEVIKAVLVKGKTKGKAKYQDREKVLTGLIMIPQRKYYFTLAQYIREVCPTGDNPCLNM